VAARRKSAAKNSWKQGSSFPPTSESESQPHPTWKETTPKKSPPTTPRKMAPTTMLSSWPVQRGRRRPPYPPNLRLRSRQSRWINKSVQQQARLHDEDGPWLHIPHFPLNPLPPVLLFTHWTFHFQSFLFHPPELSLPVLYLFTHWSFHFQSFSHPLELSPLAGRKKRELSPPPVPPELDFSASFLPD
jgi:hypothetical protein